MRRDEKRGEERREEPAYFFDQIKGFYDACRRSGYQDGGDMNDGKLKEGIYQGQSNIKHGVRQSTSITYLMFFPSSTLSLLSPFLPLLFLLPPLVFYDIELRHLAPVLATRRNIEFRTSATVTEVLFDRNNNAVGVLYPCYILLLSSFSSFSSTFLVSSPVIL